MYDSFYTMVMLIFGNPQNAESDGSHFGGIRLAIISIISLVQVLTFLNFLIAFINSTHDTVEGQKDLYDVKELWTSSWTTTHSSTVSPAEKRRKVATSSLSILRRKKMKSSNC